MRMTLSALLAAIGILLFPTSVFADVILPPPPPPPPPPAWMATKVVAGIAGALACVFIGFWIIRRTRLQLAAAGESP